MNGKLLIRLIILMIVLKPLLSNAAFLRNVPINLTQPDGKIIHCFATGDEYYNWVHDKDNFTITRNHQTGYYVFANIVNDELIPTQYIVGTINPANTELQSGINISSAKMLKIRQSRLKQFPNKPNNKNVSQEKSGTTGTINNIVIFIRFSGESEYTDQNTLYSNMFNNSNSGYNSMQNYYKEVSYNTLTINSTFYPTPIGSAVISYQDSYPRSYYQPYDPNYNPNGYTNNDITSREHTLLQNAINAISSQIPSSLNLDNDNDGYVDNICFIVAGNADGWSNLLWPHMWTLNTLTVMINGKQVNNYNFQLQSFLLSNGVGVLCHEMFHSLGSPDLYHYSYDGFTPVGTWDIMENGMDPPQHMSSYMKFRYGQWISSIPQITTPGTYTLNPLTSSTNNCFKIAATNSNTEYFVLEYRRRGSTFENSLPASGLLIYRINAMQSGSGNTYGPPDEVYLYRLNGTTSTDGNIDSANFSLNGNRTTFNNISNPNCFLSDGNLGGLNISNITSAGGSTISFTYNASSTNSTPPTSMSASPSTICSGSSTTVSLSGGYLGTGAIWKWYLNSCGGTVIGTGTSYITNPIITTIYYVRAEGNLNTTTCANKTVTVNNGISTNPPLIEDFFSNIFPPADWTLSDIPYDNVNWIRDTTVGGFGLSSNSAKIDFYNIASGQIDEMNIKPINLSSSDSALLTFNVAYAQYNSVNTDEIKILVSIDCGASYTTVYSKFGSNLATAPISVGLFIPTSNQWRTDTVNLTPFIGNSSVYIKFIGISDYGNDAYVDDIKITSRLSNYPVAGIITGPLFVCNGSSATYSVVFSAGVTYSWIAPNGWTGSSNNNSITFISDTVSGNIVVTPTNSYGNGSSSSIYITVNINSTIPISASATHLSINPGNSTTLFQSGGVLGTSSNWFWYNATCGVSFIGNGDSLVQNPTSTTTYYIRAEGICNTTSCLSITIIPLSINNELLKASNLLIYPNPAKDKLVIKNIPINSIAKILSIDGKLLVVSNLNLINEIDISYLSKGYYIIKLQTPKGIIVRSFIKE